MITSTHNITVHPANWISRFGFWCIRLMHDNFLIRRFRNPHEILETMGVKLGARVLEIGCGPGFFTLPAAEKVGSEGSLTAFDVNPFAVEYVKRKLTHRNLNHVEVKLANAADSGLPDNSFDLAFFIGVPHVAGGLSPVADELKRVLRQDGRVAFHSGRWSVGSLVALMKKEGFDLVETRGKVGIFSHIDSMVTDHV